MARLLPAASECEALCLRRGICTLQMLDEVAFATRPSPASKVECPVWNWNWPPGGESPE